MELTTKRLILRPFTIDDCDAVHAYASNAGNVRYMIWGPNEDKDTTAFIEDCLSKGTQTPRLNYDFAVTLKDTGKLIGGCGIYLNEDQTEGMIGWILHRDYWKQGYTPEAAMALLKLGFELLKLHRVYATCNAENYGSWRVMEKCGMRREAHFKSARFGRVGDEKIWYDEYHYAMLNEEWDKDRADVCLINDAGEKARIARDISTGENPQSNDPYALLAQRAKDTDFSGMISVTQGGRVQFEYAGGMADRANGRAIDRDTLFGIASGTKLLTALTVGQLIDQGRFTLDTPAADFADPGIDSYDRSVTIRQLLSHTSGIPDYLDESLLESMDSILLAIPNAQLLGPRDYLPMFPRTPMRFTPGSGFRYNNGAYVWLALIAEKASGLSYAAAVNEQLLRPIGVARGGVYATNTLPANTAFGYIERDGQWVTNIFDVPAQAGGDGGVLLSAPEMRMLWERFIGGEILSPELTREFLTPHAAVSPDEGICYGLGMWLKQTAQGFMPYIEGSDAGISFKSVCSIPDMRVKTAISNTTDGVWELEEAFDAV